MENNDRQKGQQTKITEIKIISKKANVQAEDIRSAGHKQRTDLQHEDEHICQIV